MVSINAVGCASHVAGLYSCSRKRYLKNPTGNGTRLQRFENGKEEDLGRNKRKLMDHFSVVAKIAATVSGRDPIASRPPLLYLNAPLQLPFKSSLSQPSAPSENT
jgi:hypothetical protein